MLAPLMKVACPRAMSSGTRASVVVMVAAAFGHEKEASAGAQEEPLSLDRRQRRGDYGFQKEPFET